LRYQQEAAELASESPLIGINIRAAGVSEETVQIHTRTNIRSSTVRAIGSGLDD
jgi:hypothetical protein